MSAADRLRIPLRAAIVMIGSYARTRILDQLRSVAFIIIYLVAFQTIVLSSPPADAVQLAGGIGMVVFGLVFFLEGLLIGIMPLGEQVGTQLPKHAGITVIAIFGVVVGVGSTLAEPAIAALRVAGSGVTPWDAPILYTLIEQRPDSLIMAIGVGVGIAVALGMVRFFYGLSIKPFVYIIIPILIATTVGFSLHGELSNVIGLAWDSGAVTTGPVTVPLVIALGIGATRAAGRKESASGGFGVIMLASALPVLAVLWLAFVVGLTLPGSLPEEEFFSPDNRQEALELTGDEGTLERVAFSRGSEAGRRAYYQDPQEYEQALRAFIEEPDERQRLLGRLSLVEWVETRASDTERARIPRTVRREAELRHGPGVANVLSDEALGASRAVLPLAAILLVVLLVFLRDRPRHVDEVALGLAFALVGMTLLTAGIRFGLEPLGDEVGRQLPRAFRSEPETAERLLIPDFDPDMVQEAIGPQGERQQFFYFTDDGSLERMPFDPEQYNEQQGVYELVLTEQPLFGPELTYFGVALVLLFAFGMGYGATLAEPALNALGRTVEHLSVGTIPRQGIVIAVAIGVGFGITAGVGRILYDIPISMLLVPAYLIVLVLTTQNEDDFAAIAWDSGGVTTGPVTVPLVLAMGLGIGSELGIVEGFGVLALASVMPILSVLVYGLIIRTRQRRVFERSQEDGEDA